MIKEYVDAALKKAHYEIIEDEEPYYGEIPELTRNPRKSERNSGSDA
jgi:hypothetical protein